MSLFPDFKLGISDSAVLVKSVILVGISYRIYKVAIVGQDAEPITIRIEIGIVG